MNTDRLLLLLLAVALAHAAPASAHESDDPVLTRVMIDQLEWRAADGADPFVLEAQGWIGKDLDKLWIKTDVERVDGVTEEAEVQALYSRAIAPFWDAQIGLRQDFKPAPDRTWGAIGVHGLAPYFFEVDAAVFVGDAGATAARLSAEYEWMLTQRLVLSPEISLDFYGQNDRRRLAGSGLSEGQAGLRLRYEIRREFAPYVGVNWTRRFGNTADFARDDGEPASDFQWVAGVRAWF
jgi:copper resistance protein B